MFWGERRIVRVVKVHKAQGTETGVVIEDNQKLDENSGVTADDLVEVSVLVGGDAGRQNPMVRSHELLPVIFELMWPNKVKEDDIEIVTEATREQPGVARLGKAILGAPQNGAYSIPVLSPGLGGCHDKVGFLTRASELMKPYDSTYHLW